MTFDLNSLFLSLSTIVSGSIGVWLSTELVKKIPAIPVNDGQKVRIRATALALSAIVTAVVAWTNDSLRPENVQDVMVAVVAALTMWGGAHSIHTAVEPK